MKWKNKMVQDLDSRDAGSGDTNPDDILSIFRMDFEGEQEKAPEAESAPAEPTQEPVPQSPDSVETPAPAEPQAAEPETPAQAEASAPQPAPQSPNAEELLAQALEVNKRLAAQLEAQKSPSAQPTQPEDDEDTKVFTPKKPEEYTFEINSKLYEGLFGPDSSQEERIMCLKAYASGIATTVHNNILATLGKWTRENFESVPGVVQMMIGRTAQASQTSSQIREEFYSKNPDLKRPELYPLLKATIQAVQKETKATQWSPQLADSVASRVRQILSGYAATTKPKPAAPLITPVAAKPAPTPVSTDPNGEDAILATLNSVF